MSELYAVARNPLVHAGIAGFLTALAIDFQAFRAWKSFHDIAAYNWSTAVFRWVQGFVIGAGMSSVLGTLVS